MTREPDRPTPTVRPTRPVTILVAALTGAMLGWMSFTVMEALGWTLPQLPLVIPLAISLLAVVIGWQARRVHRQIQRDRKLPTPELALRWLALGKASLLAGIGLAGGYLAVASYFWARRDAALPAERVTNSLIAVVAALLLAAAGFWLERACRIPKDDSEDQ